MGEPVKGAYCVLLPPDINDQIFRRGWVMSTRLRGKS